MIHLVLIIGTVFLHYASGTDDPNTVTECASQEELDAVERKVDELYSQLHYWQNVTINILKEQYFPSNPGQVSECSHLETLESAVLNITQSNKEISEQLKKLEKKLESTNGSMVVINEQLESLNMMDGVCSNVTTGSFDSPAHNCSHIKREHPSSNSGVYWLQRSPGYAVKVYCDMERVCGCAVGRGESGVWMRVADIDMTRPKESCPSGFRKITSSGKTMCGGQSRTCTSTTFTSHGVPYSRVCGRIIGYQFGRPNGFTQYVDNRGTTIDTYFLDGIVLTYGSPRCHIWSFAAGKTQYRTDKHGCPCNGVLPGVVPPYVGNDYFCDSGHPYNTEPQLIYFTNDPLWDGSGCVRGTCCQFNSPPWFCKDLPEYTTEAPPWFCKDLPEYTTEDIELRLCLNEGVSNEDTPIEVVELYVQ